MNQPDREPQTADEPVMCGPLELAADEGPHWWEGGGYRIGIGGGRAVLSDSVMELVWQDYYHPDRRKAGADLHREIMASGAPKVVQFREAWMVEDSRVGYSSPVDYLTEGTEVYRPSYKKPKPTAPCWWFGRTIDLCNLTEANITPAELAACMANRVRFGGQQGAPNLLEHSFRVAVLDAALRGCLGDVQRYRKPFSREQTVTVETPNDPDIRGALLHDCHEIWAGDRVRPVDTWGGGQLRDELHTRFCSHVDSYLHQRFTARLSPHMAKADKLAGAWELERLGGPKVPELTSEPYVDERQLLTDIDAVLNAWAPASMQRRFVEALTP